METKSRYEVIAELEAQKRQLIRERDGFADEMEKKSREIKMMERQKADQIVLYDRKLSDMKEEFEFFKKTCDGRKETIEELIKSVDSSLQRFK